MSGRELIWESPINEKISPRVANRIFGHGQTIKVQGDFTTLCLLQERARGRTLFGIVLDQEPYQHVCIQQKFFHGFCLEIRSWRA